MTLAIDPAAPETGSALAPPAPPAPPVEWHPSATLAPVALLLLVAGLALAGSDGLTPGEVIRAALVVTWAAAGAVLVTRRPLRPLGLVVLSGVAAAALACLASAAVEAGWSGAPTTVALVARALAVALLPAVGLHLLLGLPHGELRSRPRRTAAIVGYSLAAALGLGLWAARPDLPTWPLWLAGALALASGILAANRRYVRTVGVERQRLQWVGCALAVVVEATLVVVALRALVDWPHPAALVAASSTVLVPLALVAGASRLVTRVDRTLVHTVSLTGLTGVVAATYLVIVVGLGRVPDDTERSLLVLSMVAAAVAAAVYLPARQRLADVTNRLVYGEREAPDEVLRTFGSRLSRAIPMDELLLQLVESLRKTMVLAAAEVWTGADGRLVRTVSVPDRAADQLLLGPAELPVVARSGVSGPAWLAVWLPALLQGRADTQLRVAPVTHSGALLGLIVAERAPGADAFDEEDERVLTELARQVGLALHNVALDSALQASLDEVRRYAGELQASRARIVATADAERRRIERNLHDGAQQHLVALAVNLRLARDFVGDDPTTAAAMLDELASSIKDTIAELRDLAHGIYPPLLVDSGLAQALRAAAGRSPLEVDVQAEDVERYPTDVEAAVYFCCLEALQNAAKHAPGSQVTVRVWEQEAVLRFEVADNGPGFDPARAGRGHGFVNMGDRLGAFGGTVTWDSTPGQGTRISGQVPVPRTVVSE
ncbi:MAG: GAF domain-containing sensor histidine kinase [Actinomycetota bacterium]|nr:GAF domain-containing sensor histidine kinase [Actinomycetota bacterium]